MFTKDQPKVITDEEVGEYVKRLHEGNALEAILDEVEDGLAINSTEPTNESEGKNGL